MSYLYKTRPISSIISTNPEKMPKPKKTLEDYLTKVKKDPTPHLHFPSKKISSSTSWILRGCKHPKTHSFSFNHNPKGGRKNDDRDAATLADIDRFLFENFKSFYINDDDDGETKKMGGYKNGGGEEKGGVVLESSRFIDPLPDVCSSPRFFVGSGSSSSLMEEAMTSITTTSGGIGSSSSSSSITTSTTTTNETTTGIGGDDAKEIMGADDFIAVFTYSPSPYDDFRHSMEEMIEARLHHQGKVDWEFMEELLFCYLDLNDKKSYKYILSAFVDLIAVLRENSGKLPAKSRQVQPTGERRE